MTLTIYRSQLEGISDEDFAHCVRVHADNLLTYSEHIKRLKNKEPGVAPYPAPGSLRIIDKAVRRPDFVPDYKIVEDPVGLGE